MKIMTIHLFLALIMIVGCGPAELMTSQLATPPTTNAQVLVDLDALVAKVETLYGPLEFKEDRFGYKFTDLVSTAKSEINAAKSEAEANAALARMLAKFRDGHVSIRFPINSTGIASYKIDAFLIPVEGRAIFAKVNPELSEQGIEVGDELLSIDSEKPFDILQTILKYESLGNELSDQHAIYRVLDRKYYYTELLPKSPLAHLKIAKQDGVEMGLTVAWTLKKELAKKVELVPSPDNFVVSEALDMSIANEGGLMEMGAYKPFFVSKEVSKKFNLIEVQPNEDYLKKYEVTAEQLKDKKGNAIYAALFKYEGKTILLVRQPGYHPSTLDAKNLVKGYRAILDQYESIADALVIDQTHNPGGSLMYAHEFFSLFVNKPAANLVQKVNADRDWVFGLHEWADEIEEEYPGLAQAMRTRSTLIDQAMDAGKSITDPMPLVGYEHVKGDEKYTWKKPVMVLADELAGSCGDIFPMYMQRNSIGKVFGERTMGLGGNVEEVIQLPYSGAKVRLTRGLFTTYRSDANYTKEVLVENNGIQPDISYKHTVEDVRAGFVGYFEAFAKEAAKL